MKKVTVTHKDGTIKEYAGEKIALLGDGIIIYDTNSTVKIPTYKAVTITPEEKKA
jgi:hypothetical protein